MKYIIRPVTLNDFEGVMVLLEDISESIRQHPRWESYQVQTERNNQLKIFNEAINGGENVMLIAEGQNKLVGFVNMQLVNNLRHGWKRGHIEEIVVASKYRGKGIGTALIDGLKTYCLSNDIHMIKLMCGNQLVESQCFYEKRGFAHQDRGYRLELV